MVNRRVLFFAFLLVALTVANAQAAVIHVGPMGSDANDGSDWASAKETIQGAIDAAGSGDEIWVKTGTYKPQTEPGNSSPTDDQERHFRPKNNVSLYGGFRGDETSREERDISANPTVLSGDIGTQGDASDNCYHVVKFSSGSISRTTIIDGFTITLGTATPTNARGGGIVVENCDPTIRNCTFDTNLSTTSGGGLALWVSDALVENCRFLNNTGGRGGALYSSAGSPEIVACSFLSNISGHIRQGGAIYVISTTMTITNCTFFDNEADTYDGGGIYSSTSDLVVTHCTFSGNTARNGGGLAWVTTAPKIINSIFWGNIGTISDAQLVEGVTVSNSVIEGGYTGSSIVTTDPGLLPVADNDGPVETMALPTDSSAHNIGAMSGAPSHDARGRERIDSLPDAGAYEYDTFRLEFINGAPNLGALTGDTLQFIDINKNATAVTAEAQPGYHFYRWEKDGSTYSTHARIEVINLAENMILTAQFNIPPVASAVTTSATVNSTVILSGSGSYDPDNAPNTPLGYQWTFISSNPSTIATPTLTNADTMNATFTPSESGTYTFVLTVDDGAATDTTSVRIVVSKEYTITVSANVGGQVRLGEYGTGADTVSETVEDGEDSSLIYAIPVTGYCFSRWSDSNTSNPRRFTSVSVDQSVTAEFSTISYSVTFQSTSGGRLTGTLKQTIAHGASATEVTAEFQEGYIFSQWTLNGKLYSPEETITVTNVIANMDLYAVFEASASDEAEPTPVIVKSDSGACFISGLTAGGRFNILPIVLIGLLVIFALVQRSRDSIMRLNDHEHK